MATQNYDIAATFPSGVNLSTFARTYYNELTTTGGLTDAEARVYARETRVDNGVRKPGRNNGQVFIGGTLLVGIGDGTVTRPIQDAINNAIAAQTGNDYEGARLAQLGTGEAPGATIYVVDGTRQSPETGTGALVYWDGEGNWRYVRDDSIAITP